jgi:hypothetical protein
VKIVIPDSMNLEAMFTSSNTELTFYVACPFHPWDCSCTRMRLTISKGDLEYSRLHGFDSIEVSTVPGLREVPLTEEDRQRLFAMGKKS